MLWVSMTRVLLIGLLSGSVLAGQQPTTTAYSWPEQVDQKAAATSPAGIHDYSRVLVEHLVPASAVGALNYPPTPLDPASKQLIDSLSNRLADAEQAARDRRGKLVPEGDVARAFNDLMRRVGAPSSYVANEADIHAFRAHAAELKTLPSLLTEDHNGTNCNPGEAAFLVYELIGGNGKLGQHELDAIVQLRQARESVSRGKGRAVNGSGYAPLVGQQGASALLLNYSQHHRHATSRVYNDFAKMIGF
jgi:hypothetical protein